MASESVDSGSPGRELPGSSVQMHTQRVSALDGLLKKSVASAPESESTLVITERRDCALVQLFARPGQHAALATRLGISGEPGVATVNVDFTALPLSRGQWMLSANAGADGRFCEQVRTQVKEAAYVSEQSHGRVIVRISGANARRLIQKGCRLDLHPQIASAGYCAQTPMAQVGVLIHQLDNTPSYDLYVYSGFAQSFWRWLTESAAQYGYTAR